MAAYGAGMGVDEIRALSHSKSVQLVEFIVMQCRRASQGWPRKFGGMLLTDIEPE